MRKFLLIGLITLSLTSCTLTSYMTTELTSNYQLQMTSKKEKALVDKIQIFLSESEIKGEFEILSLNTYSPIVIPVLGNRKKIVSERLYKKAVKAAEMQKGNGVIILDDSHFKVVALK